jgi:hypothetical protein
MPVGEIDNSENVDAISEQILERLFIVKIEAACIFMD